jgi:hypothetical protein
MSILYCTECGYKNEYSIHPPNFCGGCGVSLGGEKAPPKRKSKGGRRSAEDHDPDETDIVELPDISKLDVEISYEGQGRVFKGGDIMNIPKEEMSNRKSSSQ